MGQMVGAGADEKPDPYLNPSLSTAKRIRKEIEDRFPELAPPLRVVRDAEETDEEAAA
jgi:hypothetical protein